MLKWIMRANSATKKVLDILEYKFSDLTYWTFNIMLKWVYDKIIVKMLNFTIMMVEILLYIPLYIIFILPSMLVELFEFTKNVKINNKVKNKIDKLN